VPWIGGLRTFSKPLLHLHTQFDRELPWGELDIEYMNFNSSAHGDREFGYLESRMGMTRKTVVGHWQAPRVQEQIGMWARAACGWQEAGRLQVARFGDGLAVADASASVVEGLLADYERDYELAPELRTGGELVHGGLRLPPWPGGAGDPGCAHAGGLSLDRRRATFL